MQIKCAKCSKILLIPDDKLPKDKDRMVIKCPACGQALAFSLKGHSHPAGAPASASAPTGAPTASAIKNAPQGQSLLTMDAVHGSSPTTGSPSPDGTIIMAPSHSQYNPHLRQLQGGMEFRLMTGDNIIGRSSGTDEPGKQHIRVTGDPFISGKHCLIRVSMQHGIPLCVISDDGSISSTGEPSTNGTFHNGKKINTHDKICLTEGDTIRIGHTEFIFDV